MMRGGGEEEAEEKDRENGSGSARDASIEGMMLSTFAMGNWASHMPLVFASKITRAMVSGAARITHVALYTVLEGSFSGVNCAHSILNVPPSKPTCLHGDDALQLAAATSDVVAASVQLKRA